jgi:hypothetical protein
VEVRVFPASASSWLGGKNRESLSGRVFRSEMRQ